MTDRLWPLIAETARKNRLKQPPKHGITIYIIVLNSLKP
jgi:hypothetical protein